MELAAQAFALGISDGVSAIESGDPARLLILAAVVRRAFESRKALDDHLAIRIAVRVGELWSGRKGS